MLEISLLGKFDLQLNGQAVEIPSRPAQSLLAYLLLKSDTAHRREKLAGLLWPDATETNARSYLRQALWRVRKALDSADGRYLIADDLSIAFDTNAPYRLDVAVLERAVPTEGATEDLVQCVSVYRGELLPGFYNEWAALERERLQAVFENKMNRLLDRLVAERRWPAVVEWAERWIALGQVPEPAYRGLMLAHHGLGDRSSMAAVYQRCEETLRRELGVEPSELTRALYTRLSKTNASRELAPSERARGVSLVDHKRLSTSVTQGSLPRQLTSFIGREQEVAAVKQLFADSLSRLVTLTGVGGCGKTRLALQVGQGLVPQYPQAVWFVELAALSDPALVPQTVAATLGLLEGPGRPILKTLTDYLRAKNTVLILDNCEHLVEACAQLSEALLRACPHLHILASSREALGVAGETVFQVPSLPAPLPSQTLSVDAALQYEAVRLFVDRAQTAQPGFSLTSENAAAVAQVCHRLDGIPLAVELAAARVKLLTPEQIAARLSDRFRLLTGGSRTALPRQQTLRATLDWSYNLLSEAERQLLCHLSAFASGWTLEAAEGVCGQVSGEAEGAGETPSLDVLDLLTQLVNKSLVVAEQAPGETTRYRLLETIRHYAREKLMETGEGVAVRDRHLAYFLALAERAAPELTGPAQVDWLNRLETELDNVRAALEWAQACAVEAGLRLATLLGRFWDAHDHSHEGSDWLARLLQQPAAFPDSRARARALGVQGMLLVTQGNLAQAQTAAEASLAQCRAQADPAGEAFSLMILGQVTFMHGNIAEARPLLEESLALYQALGDKVGPADVYSWLSLDHRVAGDARACLEESLAINRELGHVGGIANSLVSLAQLAYWEGDYVTPLKCLEEAMVLQRQLGSKSGVAWVLQNYGNLAFRQGDYEQARARYAESIALSEAAGQHDYWSLANLAHIAVRQGNGRQARTLFEESLQKFREAEINNGLAYCMEGLAALAVTQGQPQRSVRLLAWADAIREAIGDSRPAVEQVVVDCDLATIHRSLDEAAFAAAYAEGQRMTMEQAIAYALEPGPA
jgi:predicted ATPase/DNA-binding SARP family transcriptional activator